MERYNKYTPEPSLKDRAEAIGLYDSRLIDWVIRVEQLTKQRDELLKVLENIKSNLMHHRRFGTDTLQAWTNAAVNAEHDAEEAIVSVKGEQ